MVHINEGLAKKIYFCNINEQLTAELKHVSVKKIHNNNKLKERLFYGSIYYDRKKTIDKLITIDGA